MSASGSAQVGVSQAPILIYDGDCAFCSSTIRMMEKFMRNKPPMVPFQFIDTGNYGLTKQQCSEEIKFVDESRKIHGGESAFRNLFLEVGGPWRLIGALMGIPGIRALSASCYKWVARNRYRLPGGTPTCSLPRNYEN